MIYLLVTCILSLFARGSQPVLTRVKRTPPEAIGLSAVTIMEVAYGLALNPARAVLWNAVAFRPAEEAVRFLQLLARRRCGVASCCVCRTRVIHLLSP